jgi:hypothetical protein
MKKKAAALSEQFVSTFRARIEADLAGAVP